MNSAKKFIDKLHLQNSDYTSPESAQNLANSLESLSTDIYTDSQRFVYELLQNADDASSGSGNLELAIRIVDQYLVVSHNGKPFTQVDIESVCSVGDGNKRGDENTTGFKGIGFKSVFSHSDLVIINSGSYCFKFDKDDWSDYWKNNWGEKEEWETERRGKGKQSKIKMPWQVIPIWTDLPKSLDFTKDFKVSTIIRYDNTEKLQKDLVELFADTQILLFLRSKQIKISIRSKALIFSIEKITKDGIVTLKRNNQSISEWLLKSFVIDVDVLMENDIRIPQKLRQSNRTEVSFAVQIENNTIKATDKENSLIFTYLPTSVNHNFPFLVNASFLTDAGRQHLHEDLVWNIWLFRQIPIMFFTWLSELAKSRYKNQILKLVPQKFSSNSSLKISFNSGFDEALKNIAFIPNKEGKLLKVCEAIFDKTKISDFIGSELLIDYINSTNNGSFTESALIPRLDPISTLEWLGVGVFDVNSLALLLTSTIFQENHHIEQNFGLISFLHNQSKNHSTGQEKEEWLYRLKSIPFIFDESENLKNPKGIYFPAVEFSNDFDENEISIIHPKIMQQIESNFHIKNWFEDLGIKEPTDISFIERTIIEDKNYINTDNAIKIGQYLFMAHKKGILTNKIYQNLKQIKLLSTENKLVIAQQAYLSKFYEPAFQLDGFLEGNIFVSNQHLRKVDLKSEWKEFFIKIGVSETISLKEKEVRVRDSSIEHEYLELIYTEAKELERELSIRYPNFFQLKTIPSDVDPHVVLNSIVFLEFASEYDFSKEFWNQAFTFITPENILNHATLHWGRFSHNFCEVTNYIHWAFKNLEIIPTTIGKCLKSKDVFINDKAINELGGNYLPVFDYEGSIPQQWLTYFKFKSLKDLELDDYLSILSSISHEQSTNQDLIKTNQRRIKYIYEKLADNYLRYSDHLKQWGNNNKILSKNGKSFFNPSKLFVITVEGFKGHNLAFYDERNEKIIDLLKIFGVSVIADVKPDIHGQVERQDLKNKIKEVLVLIAVISVEKSKSKNWETEYKRLDHKLSEVVFFEASEIYLSYGNLEDKQSRSSWAKDNHFYYVGMWNKPRVLDGIVETLGRFLGVRHEERHLSVLLSDTFEEGILYLKEKFGDSVLEIIPNDLLTPSKLDEIDVPLSIHSNQISNSINSNNDDGVSKEELAAEYGRQGESLAKRFYTDCLGYKVNQPDENGYDLACRKSDELIKVEVKAITFSRPNIRITQKEWEQMMNNQNVHSYEIFIFSHSQGELQQLIRIKEAWLTLQSILSKLHNQSKSICSYGSGEIELLIGFQLNQSKSGNDVIINWHRLMKDANHGSIEKYQYDEVTSKFEKL